MSRMTRPPDSTGCCQSALVNKLGVSLSQYHLTMVDIANHPGMNNRPVETAVLRRQSYPIIANLPIYYDRNYKRFSNDWFVRSKRQARYHGSYLDVKRKNNLVCQALLPVSRQYYGSVSARTASWCSWWNWLHFYPILYRILHAFIVSSRPRYSCSFTLAYQINNVISSNTQI
jgi:hypothetical protein